MISQRTTLQRKTPQPLVLWLVVTVAFVGLAAPPPAEPQPGESGLTPGGCLPNETTLCIDDEPSDLRFAVSVDFETALNGGTSGQGKGITLIPLGIRRGGLFWFFDPTNPELLIKILNGCEINAFHWVFWSAGTNVGLTLRVTDTVTGETVSYPNPDGQTAEPVTDTAAFACDSAQVPNSMLSISSHSM